MGSIPKIGFREWRSRLKLFRSSAKNLRFSLLAMVIGISVLFWGSYGSKRCNFGLGFVAFPSPVAAYNVFVAVLVILLGLRVRRFGRRLEELEKNSVNSMNGLSPRGVCFNACSGKVGTCKGFQGGDLCRWTKRACFECEERDRDEEGFDGGEEDIVSKMEREIVKERELREALALELERERKAAASAAEETMAKILRLQHEKGLLEMETRQYRTIAEQKQLYDQEVIESLKWIVCRLTEERSVIGGALEKGWSEAKVMKNGDMSMDHLD